MMVHFRKRIPSEMVIRLTEEFFVQDALAQMDAPAEEVEEQPEEDGIISEDAKPGDDCHLINNRGTLILDAACCPQDIHYPTDIGLLNHARELAGDIIDKLYKAVQQDYAEKPRTYRQVAHKDFLAYTKKHVNTAPKRFASIPANSCNIWKETCVSLMI
jgi:hypothetical protein